MVVISFNYRENRLGFFAHPVHADEARDDPRGNYGYMDQIAALQWVQRNIAAFGGDPGNVTIASESAGGGSVLAMLLLPMACSPTSCSTRSYATIPTGRSQRTPRDRDQRRDHIGACRPLG